MTPKCLNCGGKYDHIYQNKNLQIVGDCHKCNSTYVIKSRPKMKIKTETITKET